MALTLGPATTENTILAWVRRLTKDNTTSPSSFATDAIVTAYANEAIIRIASLTRSRKKSNIGSEPNTVAGTRLYAKPTDCLEILQVYFNGVPLEYASYDNIQQENIQNWYTSQGTPTKYYVENDQIGLYPIPGSALKLGVFYITKPAALVVATPSGVPDLDPRLHLAIVYWVSRQIFLDRREPDFAEEMLKLFNEEILLYQASGKDSRQPQKFLNYRTSPMAEDVFAGG